MRSKSNVLLYNITAVVIGLVISGLLLLFMKVNPLDVCGQALGKIVTDQYNLGEILVKATPLIFTSLAFAFTYNANLFNIGAQGQFTMGATSPWPCLWACRIVCPPGCCSCWCCWAPLPAVRP